MFNCPKNTALCIRYAKEIKSCNPGINRLFTGIEMEINFYGVLRISLDADNEFESLKTWNPRLKRYEWNVNHWVYDV